MFAMAIHFIWILIPAVYLFYGIWGILEQLSKSNQKQNPNDFFRQGAFVAVCVGIAFIIDYNFLENFVDGTLGGAIPIELAQVLLLPLIFVIGAIILGPTKEQLINTISTTDKKE